MKHTLLTGLLCVGSALAVQAQSDFRPGYIVQPAGDTLRGEVDYRGAQRSSRLARFRPSASGAVTEYQPEQLRGYGFPGSRAYESHEVVADSSNRRQRYFLEVLAVGKASVYSLRDEKDREHYYLSLGTEPVAELVKRTVRVKDADGRMFDQEQPIYRNMLAAAFSACPDVQGHLSKLPFSSGALAGAAARYNECMSGSVMKGGSVRQRPKAHATFTVTAGAGTSTLTIKESAYSSDGEYKGSLKPVVGLGMNFSIPAVSEKLSFQLEGQYHAQSYNLYSSWGTSTSPAPASQKTSFSYVRVPVLLRYSLQRGLVRPYVQAGITLGMALEKETDLRLFPTYHLETLAIDNSIRRFEQAFAGGVGVRIGREGARKLSVEARYERSNGFSTVVGTSTTVARIFGLLSYDLTK
ncbi:porin family protein [Hymenobacter sp. CRA2]|uniref:porin family protein n=1 Tax=Hymenobacter sp. CRA2 TaxID=1955620 RepID=UPI00098F53C8|nr:porin family protein [Hymenobacter sp. CRA2]OON69109.1 hypothetical protein B0919_10390 [Hymenobacter sp. CRA2]